MAERTIECKDCGSPFPTTRSNAKYCRVCRLYRNLVFLRDSTFECAACGTTVAPVVRDGWVCSTCDPTMGCSDVTGCCSLCSIDAKLPYEELAVCEECLNSPDQRRLLVSALRAKVNRLKEENGLS